jgi:hypothetical protein
MRERAMEFHRLARRGWTLGLNAIISPKRARTLVANGDARNSIMVQIPPRRAPFSKNLGPIRPFARAIVSEDEAHGEEPSQALHALAPLYNGCHFIPIPRYIEPAILGVPSSRNR